MSVPSSISALAGSLYTLVRKGGQPPGGASDLGVLQQLGELRAPRLLSKRNSPSKLTATQAVPGNWKSMTHPGAAEGVPCSVIQKVVVASWAHHTSCWMPLHLESPPHRQVFVFWVTGSHTWQRHLTSGQKAQVGFRCVPLFLLNNTDAHGSLGEVLDLSRNCLNRLHTTGYLSVTRSVTDN